MERLWYRKIFSTPQLPSAVQRYYWYPSDN